LGDLSHLTIYSNIHPTRRHSPNKPARGKYAGFNIPHGKPSNKEKNNGRPRNNRPPKSDSQIPTSNKYAGLDKEADDGSS